MLHYRVVFPRVVLLCVLGALLGPAGGCGVGGGRRIGLPEGGALRPSKLAYAVTPEAGTVVPGLAAIEIPPSVDLRREGIVPPIQNQVFNSCVGWSIGYYVMSGVLAREMRGYGKYLDMQKCENWFSPEFLYSQRDNPAGRVAAVEDRMAAGDPIRGLSLERDNDVAFMRPEEALVALFEHGICPWSWLSTTEGDPEHLGCASSEDAPGTAAGAPERSRAPWQYAQIIAEHFRPRCYVRFGDLDDLAGGTARRLRAWLADEGTPIAAVVQMSGGWVRFRGDNRVDTAFVDPCGVTRVENRGVCLNAIGDPMSGAHMMTLIGYDTSFPASAATADIPEDLRGSFLFANQWGEKWGDGGYMWIPATELAKVWVAGYGIIGDDGSEFEFGNPATAQKPLCFQDETGKYIGISRDGNDVPANLLTATERCALQCLREAEGFDGFEPGDTSVVETLDPPCTGCVSGTPPGEEGDVARVTVVNTACRITWPGTSTTLTRVGAVGGQAAGDSVDSADWFWFDVPTGDVPSGSVPVRAHVTDGMGTCLPLELKITNAAYEEVTVPEGAGDCAVVTRLGVGRHFVKIAVPSPPQHAGELTYTLTLEIGALLPGEAPATPVPYAERCLPVERVEAATLAGRAPAPSEETDAVRDLFRVTGARQGVDFVLSVALQSAGPGSPDVQFFAMVSQGRTERVESRRIQGPSGTIRIGLNDALGNGELNIGIRNLSGEAVTYTLDVQTCGKRAGDFDPATFAFEELGPMDGGPGREVYFLERDWFLLRGYDELHYVKRDRQMIEVTNFCRRPTALLSMNLGWLEDYWVFQMDCGDPVYGSFELEVVRDTPFAHATRFTDSLVTGEGDNVRFALFHCSDDGGPDEPLRQYSVRTFTEASLAAWPSIDDVDLEYTPPKDGNDTPAQAETWTLTDEAPSQSVPYTAVGETGGIDLRADFFRRIDPYDFYRVVNATGTARDVRLTLTPDNQVPTGQTILVEVWVIDPVTNLATAAATFSASVTDPPISRVVSIPAAGSALVMLRVASGRAYGGYGLSATLE